MGRRADELNATEAPSRLVRRGDDPSVEGSGRFVYVGTRAVDDAENGSPVRASSGQMQFGEQALGCGETVVSREKMRTRYP
jgi:hypothetical protein